MEVDSMVISSQGGWMTVTPVPDSTTQPWSWEKYHCCEVINNITAWFIQRACCTQIIEGCAVPPTETARFMV
eukprot:c38769_g1_i1 orf=44-259(+)